MNAKKARMLRNAARDESVGTPWESYVSQKHQKQGYNPVTIRLHPLCGKAIYRHLKKTLNRN